MSAQKKRNKKEKGQFIIFINLEEVGKFASFAEAFRAFYKEIEASVKNGTIPTWQLLETACYIEQRIGGLSHLIWGFEEAKEVAFAIGILTIDGKLLD